MPKLSNKPKDIFVLPTWARRVSSSYVLPELNDQEEHLHLRSVGDLASGLFKLHRNIPDETDWPIISGSEFQAARKQIESIKDNPRYSDLALQLLGNYWSDQAGMLRLYSMFFALRSASLVKSIGRCINTGESYAQVILSRSLLELLVHHVEIVETPIGVLENVSRQTQPCVPSSELIDAVENTLVAGIWGTRRGSSDIGDKAKTSIYTGWAYQEQMFENVDGWVEQKNVITSFKKRARKQDIGKSMFRVYEFLSDIAHPNQTGNFLFLKDVERIGAFGSKIYKINKTISQELVEHIAATALWIIGLSCSHILKGNQREQELLDALAPVLRRIYRMKF